MSRRSRLFVSTQVQDWGRSPLSRVPNTFTPADLSPSVWLDASDTSTITASSGDVSQWNNKGSLGNFTQATGALQPKTGVTTLNGKNVIDFAGDRITSADAAASYKFLHDGTDYIIAAVWKAGTTSDPNTIYSVLGTNVGAAGGNRGVYLVWDDRSSIPRNQTLLHNVISGTDTNVMNISGNDLVPANVFAVTTIFGDPNNGTAANRSEMFTNGGSATKNNTALAAVSSSDPTATLELGSAGGASGTFTGSIAELIIVSGTNATESNRVLLREYLRNSWAVY